MQPIQTTRSSVISQRLQSSYGDKSYYAVNACTKELLQCLTELVIKLKVRNIEEIRMILHKMLGPSRILDHQHMEALIKRTQYIVKKSLNYSYPQQEINEMKKELSDTLIKLSNERTHVNLMVYCEKADILYGIVQRLAPWPYIHSIIAIKDQNRLEERVRKDLPDVLLVIGRNQSNRFWESIAEIRKKYLGTSLLFDEGVKTSFSAPYLTKLRGAIEKSVSSKVSTNPLVM